MAKYSNAFLYGESGSISRAFLKYFCTSGSFPSCSATCPATWYSIRAFVVFPAFSYSSALAAWRSIPSFTVVSGFSRRVRVSASWSSLLPPHSSSRKVFGSACRASFFFSSGFFRKKLGGVMGFFMFDVV